MSGGGLWLSFVGIQRINQEVMIYEIRKQLEQESLAVFVLGKQLLNMQ